MCNGTFSLRIMLDIRKLVQYRENSEGFWWIKNTNLLSRFL